MRKLGFLARFKLIFGHPLIHCGFAAIAIGSFVFWVVESQVNFPPVRRLLHELHTATATITYVDYDSTARSGTGLCKAKYVFTVGNKQYEGSLSRLDLKVGSQLHIEYKKDNPRLSWLALKGEDFPREPRIAITICFVVGLLLIILGLWAGLGLTRMYVHGRPVTGVVTSLERVDVGGEHKRIRHVVTLSYNADDGKTHKAMTLIHLKYQPLQMGDEVTVLCHPRNYRKYIIPGYQTGVPPLSGNDSINSIGLLSVARALFFPILVVGSNAFYVYYKFFLLANN